ncbi:Arm DNA-binding domain-containing protein [Zoogloea sp.]|uniref:Arm DNA-binding domain-containing protein n=1 Tax=Zoogloea sp. TaxID=49181 RepID=UPI0035B4367C
MLNEMKLLVLKPAEKLYKVADRDGMYFAVLPSGVVSFRFDYRFNGRRETLTLGTYGPVSTLLHETGYNSDCIEQCVAHGQRGGRAV